MTETKKRSMAKSISWRTIAIVSTLVITYMILNSNIFPGALQNATMITVLGALSGLLLYYTHERIWVKYIKWGYIDE